MNRVGERARVGALSASLLMIAATSGCAASATVAHPTISASPAATHGEDGRGDPIGEASGPTTAFVTMTDPVQDAFTVSVPEGWDSVAYTDGSNGVYRYIVNSVSPDGMTVLYSGDPKMPQYWNPDTAHETIRAYADLLEHTKIEYYEPATFYFPQYVQRRFGGLDGFDLIGSEYDQATVEALQRAFSQAGLQPSDIDAARVYFDYTADGIPMHGMVAGYTIDSGAFWQADVSGLSTSGDVADYDEMLDTLVQSVRVKPEFTARMQRNHDEQMAQIRAFGEQMTRQHNANMAAIQESANRHQARMQALWAANDASVQSFNNRMAAGDQIQRGFLNYINGEETVSGSSGQNWQVATGFDRYWMNTSDNTYVGGDINFDDDDLRRLGLNPNDYQEVTVTR